jgi:hypothetical protein
VHMYISISSVYGASNQGRKAAVGSVSCIFFLHIYWLDDFAAVNVSVVVRMLES